MLVSGVEEINGKYVFGSGGRTRKCGIKVSRASFHGHPTKSDKVENPAWR
jgi:hypothetical protein